MIVTDK